MLGKPGITLDPQLPVIWGRPSGAWDEADLPSPFPLPRGSCCEEGVPTMMGARGGWERATSDTHGPGQGDSRGPFLQSSLFLCPPLGLTSMVKGLASGPGTPQPSHPEKQPAQARK